MLKIAPKFPGAVPRNLNKIQRFFHSKSWTLKDNKLLSFFVKDDVFSQWHRHTQRKRTSTPPNGVEPTTFHLELGMLYHSVIGDLWQAVLLNPVSPVNDQDKISPYYIYTISWRQVMRIKKNTNWSDTIFSKLTYWELFGRPVRRITKLN